MQTALHLIDATAVMSMLALIYGIVRRQSWRLVQRQVLLGIAFGLGAMTTMLQPILVIGDLIIDCRTLFIGFAGAFLGWPGALAAVVVAGAGRLAIGVSATAFFGIGSLVVAAAAGLIWRNMSARFATGGQRFAGLGLMISTSLCLLLLAPSVRDTLQTLTDILLLSAYNVVGSLLLGGFMDREHAQEQREDAARQASLTDPLTGLLNRRGFEEHFTLSEGKGRSSGTALLLIDIDHFKQVNDRHGHGAGDEILQFTGARLRETVRPEDAVLRFGGEEFGVLLANVDYDAAYAAAERIRSRLCDPCVLADATMVNVTVSIGGWRWLTGKASLSAAVAQADKALYAAKSSGRDRIVFAT